MLGRPVGMRLAHLATAVGLLCACTERARPLDAPEATLALPIAELSEQEVIPEQPPAPEPSAPAVALDAIGFEHPPKISKAARAHNRAALKLHRKGEYEASRDGFAKATELSPDHDMARFNLACALAKLGELEAARAELSTLLHRDLLRFQERWRGAKADTDLDTLRESKHAPEVDALVQRLRDAYDEAHDHGIPAYLYARPPVPAETDFAGGVVTRGSSSLIAGAWLHDAKRFVPLVRGGTATLLDLPRRRALRANVSLAEQHCDYAVYAKEELLSTSPDPAVQPEGEMRPPKDASADDDEYYGEPTSAVLTFASYDPLTPEGGSASPVHVAIDLTAEGGRFYAAAPPGYALSRRTLTVPGRADAIKLDGLYQQIFVPAAAEAPVLVLQRRFEVDTDSYDYDSIYDSTVTRVDVATGKTERLAHGDGNAWVVIAPDDSVFIELEGKTQRWPTLDAATPEPTMPGLHLAPALGDPSCMCCG